MLKPPVFILGCPRSGTTLLSELLKSSSYGKPFESRFITKYYKRLESYGDLSKKANFVKLVRDISKERAVKQWGVTIDSQEMFEEVGKHDYAHICDYICRLKGEKKGYLHWGDKTPTYTLDIDIIDNLFPDSKFIFIIRDGRDVALSLLQRSWGPNNFFTCANYWKNYHKPNKTLTKLQENGQLMYIKYEDLLQDAKSEILGVYDFIQEEFVLSNSKKQIDSVRETNFNKWKHRMSNRQVKTFESVAGKALISHGYECLFAESTINKLNKIIYISHEKVMRIVFLFKVNIIDGIRIKFLGKEPFSE